MHQIIQAVGGKELSAEMPPHLFLIKIISSGSWSVRLDAIFLLRRVVSSHRGPWLAWLAWLPPPPLLLSSSLPNRQMFFLPFFLPRLTNVQRMITLVPELVHVHPPSSA